jgi:mRNA-degrading endonuclease RelE of RelBE toxin-antitoxin system
VKVHIVWHDDAVADGDSQLVPKDKLRKAKARLLEDPLCGKPLSGPLTGARSVRVGGSENRLVYRILKKTTTEMVIEILALGRRRADEAYGTALERHERG